MWTPESSPEKSQVRLMGLNLGIIVDLIAEDKETTRVSFSRILWVFFKYQMIVLFVTSSLVGILFLAEGAEGKLSGNGLLGLGMMICLCGYMWWYIISGQNAIMQLVEDVLLNKV